MQGNQTWFVQHISNLTTDDLVAVARQSGRTPASFTTLCHAENCISLAIKAANATQANGLPINQHASVTLAAGRITSQIWRIDVLLKSLNF